MNSINDQVTINAPITKVYEALTHQDGYRGWWNAVAEVAGAVGGDVTLRFVKDGTPVNMFFRIDELTANQCVHWTCTAHDMPNWVGTSLDWKLAGDDGAVTVSLEHGGWKEASKDAALGWKHFLGSLKQYVETGTGQPW